MIGMADGLPFARCPVDWGSGTWPRWQGAGLQLIATSRLRCAL